MAQFKKGHIVGKHICSQMRLKHASLAKTQLSCGTNPRLTTLQTAPWLEFRTE